VADKAARRTQAGCQTTILLVLQEQMLEEDRQSLDQCEDTPEALQEAMFLAIYGSPGCSRPSGVRSAIHAIAPSRKWIRNTAESCR